MDTVGKILKKRRLEKNISLINISNELNISLEVLVKIENDQILKNVNICTYYHKWWFTGEIFEIVI